MNPDDEKVTAALERARGIVRLLRSECGWTSALTPQKLAPYLIEEAHEVHDAVASEAPDADLVSELGDVLFQILLHAELGRSAARLILMTSLMRSVRSCCAATLTCSTQTVRCARIRNVARKPRKPRGRKRNGKRNRPQANGRIP
ncbi:MazG nucleotide pyrophosphohydrolase domain-containing protein [Pseudoglutamicibacter albus]|uniref:MazG nucleotide pyrophosphohydrolase domain-containing protein n=1 Tax=Pseudoglutamicibacter albus TaxID=98671 RepID=UPI0036172E27